MNSYEKMRAFLLSNVVKSESDRKLLSDRDIDIVFLELFGSHLDDFYCTDRNKFHEALSVLEEEFIEASINEKRLITTFIIEPVMTDSSEIIYSDQDKLRFLEITRRT